MPSTKTLMCKSNALYLLMLTNYSSCDAIISSSIKSTISYNIGLSWSFILKLLEKIGHVGAPLLGL